jgi:hypothetical protein
MKAPKGWDEGKTENTAPAGWDEVIPLEQKQEAEIGTDMSGPAKFLTGIGAGMYDSFKGIQSLAAKAGRETGFVFPETVSKIDQERQEARDVFAPLADQSFAARSGRFVGETAPALAIPGGMSGGAIRRGFTGALSGAVQGAISDPDPISGATVGGLMGGVVPVGLRAFHRTGEMMATAKKTGTDMLPQANKYDIPVTLGERINSPWLIKQETLSEKIPLSGMTSFRKTQQESADSAAKKLLGQYIADPAAGDIMGANREFSSKMYESLKGMLPKNVAIDPVNVKDSATRLLDDYPDIFKALQDTKTERIIKDIVGGVKDIKKSVPGLNPGFASLRPDGYPGKATTVMVPKKLTFEEAWTLRQGLGDLIGQANKKAASGDISRTSVSKLNELFGSVSKDMDVWAKSIDRNDITVAFNAANDSYKKYVVKYDILQRAYDKASGEVGAGEMFSPKKFSTKLKEIIYKDKHHNVFNGKEIEEMTGLANIMQVVKRGGQYAENVPTGNRAMDLVLGTPSPISKYAIPSGIILSFLTTTKRGQDMLLSASRAVPDSARMAQIMRVIYQTAPKMAVSATTSDK